MLWGGVDINHNKYRLNPESTTIVLYYLKADFHPSNSTIAITQIKSH